MVFAEAPAVMVEASALSAVAPFVERPSAKVMLLPFSASAEIPTLCSSATVLKETGPANEAFEFTA